MLRVVRRYNEVLALGPVDADHTLSEPHGYHTIIMDTFDD